MLPFAGVFLAAYVAAVIYLFTRTSYGRRRRLELLDFVWVPMGGLTGILMMALWWQGR
jgi:hypothetical protein